MPGVPSHTSIAKQRRVPLEAVTPTFNMCIITMSGRTVKFRQICFEFSAEYQVRLVRTWLYFAGSLCCRFSSDENRRRRRLRLYQFAIRYRTVDGPDQRALDCDGTKRRRQCSGADA
jgi:hypothetical protein